MFAYCKNSPIDKVDYFGYCFKPVYTEEQIDDDIELYLATSIELGDGWYYRIDNKNEPTEHIHVFNKKKSKGWYSQNKDGSIHDKKKNGPDKKPPKKVRKKLKEKSGWDWDAKAEQLNKDKGDDFLIESWDFLFDLGNVIGVVYVIYRIIRFLISCIPAFWWTMPANLIAP